MQNRNVVYKDNTFTSSNNKGLLWDLMIENGTFEGLLNTDLKNVKDNFDIVIEKYDKLKGTITDKSKRVLTEMTEFVNIMKQKSYISETNTNFGKIPITAGELSAQRIQEFDDKFNAQREEFNNLVNRPVPKQIDFSDKNDEPFAGNMESLLNDAIARREQDIKYLKKPVEKETHSATVRLKIGNTIEKPEITNVNAETQKHVTFLDSISKEESKKLEKIYQFLEKIEAKQNKILEIISTLNPLCT